MIFKFVALAINFPRLNRLATYLGLKEVKLTKKIQLSKKTYDTELLKQLPGSKITRKGDLHVS